MKQTRRGSVKITVYWYYAAAEVFDKAPEFISKGEIFKSEISQEIPIGALGNKIKVMSIEDYNVLEEAEDDEFFTRSFFDPQFGTLEPPLEQWKTVCTCNSIANLDVEYGLCD